jgi:DNA repair protein RecN (Recombination protein N)
VLPSLKDKFGGDLAALEASEARLEDLRRMSLAAVAAYDDAANILSASRQRAAAALAQAVNDELPPLKLEAAQFIVKIEVESSTTSADGRDQVEFWVKTNPGTRPGPLMKVASGGELARFMLALKVVLADRGSAPTLVFDEIDTGAGGAVADAIGERLARLATRVQVLAVTHAPQVAAKAEGHLRIIKEKTDEADRVATLVTTLTKAARREEIARMLAGARITAEARAAAGRLLNN